MIACPPITTWAAPAAYTYQVRVEQGSVSCTDARGTLRRYIVSARTRTAWTCFRGHSGDSWAAACARDNVLTHAYGPKRERDPWRIAAAQLRVIVVRPTVVPAALHLASVSVTSARACQRLTAVYKASNGVVRLLEQRGCGNNSSYSQFPAVVLTTQSGVWVLISGGTSQSTLDTLAHSLRPVLV